MKVVVAGGSGFIGRHLKPMLESKGYEMVIVSRSSGEGRITWDDLEKDGLPDGCVAVINIAGQTIISPNKEWSQEFKDAVYDSRVGTTLKLAEAIKRMEHPPRLLLYGSAAGYYPPGTDIEFTEDSPGGDFNYLAKVAKDAEDATALPDSIPCRSASIRIGLALGGDGGVFQKMILPYWFGDKGPIAREGHQFFPWVHVDDIANMIMFAIENEHVTGIMNGVGPQLATNADFARMFISIYDGPEVQKPDEESDLTKTLGELTTKTIATGKKVIPKRTQELGYKFLYPDLKTCCEEIASVLVANRSTSS